MPDKSLIFFTRQYMFDKEVYKTWTGLHEPPQGPGPWTTPWTTPNVLKEIASVTMKIYQRSGYEKQRLLFTVYVLD